MNIAQQILADNRQANIDAKRILAPSAPACGRNQISFTFDLDDLGEVTVHCDYEAGYDATRWEPGCPEGADVTAVYLYDIEISQRCTKEEITAMEQRCLEIAQEMRDDAMVERYEASFND